MTDQLVTDPEALHGTVMVVDDEPHLVDMYAAMLKERYRVCTATSGKEAIAMLTDEIDVILLDRRMPGTTGDETLARIREQGFDCQVAMVTSIQPDVDILELEFDAYVVKPVSRRELLDVVHKLLVRAQYGEDVREAFRLASKIAALESQLPRERLGKLEEFKRLKRRKAELDERSQRGIQRLLESGESGTVFVDILGGNNR